MDEAGDGVKSFHVIYSSRQLEYGDNTTFQENPSQGVYALSGQSILGIRLALTDTFGAPYFPSERSDSR